MMSKSQASDRPPTALPVQSKEETTRIDRLFQNQLDILVILLVFAVSRILYYAVGVRFDTSSLPYFYQFLDVVWLKDDLLRSLWHLHSQPPLYNLMLGIGLKLFPDSPGPFWWGCSIAMGAAMSLMMQRSMVYLGVGRWLATVIALIYVVSPHTILYENWLFYTYPVTFLLIASVYFLARFLSRFTRTSGFLFFLTCCALILTRSAFHPLWLIASAFILLEWFPRKSKSIGIVFLIPFLLAVGWYGKNAVMFGKFSGSTWLGMSLAKGTIFRLPDEEREKWIEEGALSDISEIYPFGPIVVYEGIVPEHDPTGVPALDEPWKSNHKVNFNHLSFIEISDRYLEDSLKTIRRDPVGYGETLVRAFLLFFRPPSEMSFLDGNREKIETWNAFFTRWVTLQILPFEKATKLDREGGFPISFLVCCYFWMILFPLTLLYALRKALSYWGGNETERRKGVLLCFLVFNILYISLIGNALEYGENNRFGFLVQPLVLILFGFLLSEWLARKDSQSKPITRDPECTESNRDPSP